MVSLATHRQTQNGVERGVAGQMYNEGDIDGGDEPRSFRTTFLAKVGTNP